MVESRYNFTICYMVDGKCTRDSFDGTPADFYWFIAQLPEDARVNETTWREIKPEGAV